MKKTFILHIFNNKIMIKIILIMVQPIYQPIKTAKKIKKVH